MRKKQVENKKFHHKKQGVWIHWPVFYRFMAYIAYRLEYGQLLNWFQIVLEKVFAGLYNNDRSCNS